MNLIYAFYGYSHCDTCSNYYVPWYSWKFFTCSSGPLTSWVGFIVLDTSDSFSLSSTFIIITGVIAGVIFILDYTIPYGNKKFGGSRYGVIGTTLGLIIGLFSPIPGGVIIGPFLGALIGELIFNNDHKRAFKAAFGSFIGFITVLMKFIISLIYFGLFISVLLSQSF